MATCVRKQTLFDCISAFPSYAYFLGNLLEASQVTVTQFATVYWARDFAIVAAFLLQTLPSALTQDGDSALKNQIKRILNVQFLIQLVNVLLGGFTSESGVGESEEVSIVAETCSFLYLLLDMFPSQIVVVHGICC